MQENHTWKEEPAPVLICNGSATSCTSLCPQGCPFPAPCPHTATTALAEGGPRLCADHSPTTRVQGKGQSPTTHTPLSGTPLLKTKKLWFKALQTNKATPGLTDPHFPWILLLLVPLLSKGLQAATSSSTVPEQEQRHSPACARGDPLQTSPLLG